MFRCPSFQIQKLISRQSIAAGAATAATTATTTTTMSTPWRDPRARGRGRGSGSGGGAAGAVGPAPGPPPGPRPIEERMLALERRVSFLSYAWQKIAFERSEERAEMLRLLAEIREANGQILVELRSRAPLVPLPPP